MSPFDAAPIAGGAAAACTLPTPRGGAAQAHWRISSWNQHRVGSYLQQDCPWVRRLKAASEEVYTYIYIYIYIEGDIDMYIYIYMQ